MTACIDNVWGGITGKREERREGEGRRGGWRERERERERENNLYSNRMCIFVCVFASTRRERVEGGSIDTMLHCGDQVSIVTG